MKPMEENLKDLFMKYTADGRIPGISARVVQRGETLAHIVTGLADREAGRVLKGDALFRIYSMTKVITILGGWYPLWVITPGTARLFYRRGHSMDTGL